MGLTLEVELDDFEVGDDHGRLGSRLLVVGEPLAPQPLGLVPGLDEVRVVLDDDRVLVEPSVEVRLRAARLVVDVEAVVLASRVRADVDAVPVPVLALAEHEALERARELDPHAHVRLAAHDLEVLDLRHVRRPLRVPQLESLLRRRPPLQNSQQPVQSPIGCSLAISN